MYFVILQICAIAILFPINLAYDTNNVKSIDDQVAPLGSDVFCLFAYGSWVMRSEMQGDVPNAVYYGNARLPQHRLDFNYFSEDLCGNFPTIVPDCGYEVWGSIYLVPVQDLDLVLQKGGVDENRDAFHFIQEIVQVYYNNQFVNVKCNAFQQSKLPEKLIYGLPIPQDRRPSQQIIDMLVEAYQDAGLPLKYIEEISQLPTIEEGIIETNLTPSSEPMPVVLENNQQGP